MKVWIVESRLYSKDVWIPWDFASHGNRAAARERAASLTWRWPNFQFRVRAYQRVEGSK